MIEIDQTDFPVYPNFYSRKLKNVSTYNVQFTINRLKEGS